MYLQPRSDKQENAMKKVLLVNMPYGALDRQSLGISLLKAGLTQRGINCDIRYLTFSFAEFIGLNEYQWLSFELPYTAFAGEWTFTQALYGERPESDRRYIEDILQQTWHLDVAAIERLRRIRSFVPHFLTYCMASIPWQEYPIVGFTSTFEQNISSLALARMIKSAHPAIQIIFGGANWEGEMGLELHRQFQFVDYVCSGEADQSFPTLVQQLLADQPNDPGHPLPGIIERVNGQSVFNGPPKLIAEMDSLPVPDFSDYFHDLGQSTVGASIVPVLLLETSRGCWWGAKSHCTFCGLNGGSMIYRSKSPGRALNELETLVDQWKFEFVEVVDNILDMKYFNSMLPALARSSRPIRLFYEVKANLTRKHLQILADAGVHRIQPGIESLSDHVLKLMRKGTTALQNIQLMKWCKEYNISADWNIIYGFPGEKHEDYTKMLTLLRSIRFLKPPSGCGPIRLDRFSPYHNSPKEFGFVNVRSLGPYKYLYPFDEEILCRIAYYFDYDYEPSVDPSGFANEMLAFVAAWRHEPEQGTLYSIVRPDGKLAIIDTRSDAARSEFILSGLERAIYEYCDEFHPLSAVLHHVRHLYPELSISEQQVADWLDSFILNRLMVTDDVHYLSLAVAVQPLRPQPDAPSLQHLAGNESYSVSSGSSYLIQDLKIISE
jgi:ribosomal peptide maturation radical SAM protein 1